MPDLVAALRALDYPPEKLDIKFVLEARRRRDARRRSPPAARPAVRDHHRAASAGRAPSRRRSTPRCRSSRGTFVAVYDAEDRPEPDQLRLRLEAFVASDERLACVQARLTIDNTADSLAHARVHRRIRRPVRRVPAGARRVAVAAAARRLVEPLPHLGAARDRRLGSLQRDRGRRPRHAARALRLSHRGDPLDHLRGGAGALRPWLRQRTRWFKGWMQTWLVHMRSPLPPGPRTRAGRLRRCSSFWSAAPCWPRWCMCCSRRGWSGRWRRRRWTTTYVARALGFDVTTLLSGYLISAALGLIGLARRRLLGCAWVLLLMPVYWLLLSLAAWRALFQLRARSLPLGEDRARARPHLAPALVRAQR